MTASKRSKVEQVDSAASEDYVNKLPPELLLKVRGTQMTSKWHRPRDLEQYWRVKAINPKWCYPR